MSVKQSVKKNTPHLKTGELLISEGLVRPEDVASALSMQERSQGSPAGTPGRLIGMILCDMNLITPLDLYHVLNLHGRLQTTQEVLIKNFSPLQARIESALKESRKSGIPFLEHLRQDNVLSLQEIQKTLFELYRIPFKTLDGFSIARDNTEKLTQIIPRKDTCDGRIIPLVLKDSTLIIGTCKPENLPQIRDLSIKLPHYRITPVFIPWEKKNALMKSLYGAGKTDQITPSDVAMELSESNDDLSLLFSFSTIIGDPERDRDSILALYRRYEVLRQLSGGELLEDRSKEFEQFVVFHISQIFQTYNCKSIEFTLQRSGSSGVKIIATPKYDGRD